MKPRRLFTSIALAGICWLLTSCIDTKEPLSSPEQAKVDKELIGAWRAKFKDGTIDYYHIAPAGGKLPPGVMRIITVDYDKKGALSRPGEMLAFATDLKNHRFLNIAFIDDQELDQFETTGWKAELPKGFLIVKYQVQDDKLTVWEMDQQAKRRTIEAEKIKGAIDKNAIFFNDTPENLAALLTGSEKDNLFTKTPTEYERIK